MFKECKKCIFFFIPYFIIRNADVKSLKKLIFNFFPYRYFTCTNSDRNLVEINARMEDVETKQEQMTYLLGNLRKKDVNSIFSNKESVSTIESIR